MRSLFKKTLLLSLLLSSTVQAQSLVRTGTIIVNPTSKQATLASHPVYLMKMLLSHNAKQLLINKVKTSFKQTELSGLPSNTPASIQLGMNDVPVLDQGYHGSCVTFAVTGALDAAIGKGDYISQLCNLALGTYLSENGYIDSGWDGAWGNAVLAQISAFGIATLASQQDGNCGGLKDYPKHNAATGEAMSLESFRSLSKPLFNEEFTWYPLLVPEEALQMGINTDPVLVKVKESLAQGDRVIFGTLLLDFHLGFVGAVGTHHSQFDSWVLTTEIARDLYQTKEFGGHEMVITGYDDNAVALDDKGQEHRGLLTLRNSWGESVGDNGNFYMSYDYFKILLLDAYRIHH